MRKQIYYPMRNFLKDRWERKNIFYVIRIVLSCLAWYTAIYWVADSRYNREMTRLEARVTNLITRLEGNNWKKAIEEIPLLQRTVVPHEPLFFNVSSVYKSLNPSYDEYDYQVIKELDKMIMARKTELSEVNLSHIILSGYDSPAVPLSGNNFSNSNFRRSSLSYSIINNINFTNSDFTHTSFHDSDLAGTNFNNVIVEGANFKNTNLIGSNLASTKKLDKAELQGALYNSRAQGKEKYKKQISETEVKEYCSSHNLLNNCPNIEYFSNDQSVLTSFPAGFNPKAHGMIDASEIIESVKAKRKDNSGKK